ncbi:alpha/beta-hydrolase [Metschnikowia bicuspidata]|uniref:Alpha/beta-hydrolase n=1 Tax=Metschnikowia bicuspidata TaxID=27322 RepID=A0A4P9ZDZ5_9ASCO|nr:alpha/beta-hydrolase [Metschnikowia bicuspidata]
MSASIQPKVPLEDAIPTYEWTKSFNDWFKHLWCRDFSDAAVERRLLLYLPFFPQSDGRRVAQILDTDLGDGHYIHELFVENVEKHDPKRALTTTNTVKDIVLVHGYAASLALFLENFDDLSSVPGVRLHAIDLPGFGLSSRPKYPNFSGATKQDIYDNEDWFIDLLEKWRKKRGIERFALIGHSFGGYLSCAYTLKYNQNLIDAATGRSQRMIEKLVLVSPVGLERHARALQLLPAGKSMATGDELPSPSEEFINQMEIIHGENGSSLRSMPKNNTVAMLKWMWEHNFSPFSLMRNLGPARSKMVSLWTSRRFSHFYFKDPLKFQAIHDYFYRIFNGKGSGEYAITRILAWGALAKLPLLDRCPEKFVKMNLPTLWLYGDKDWMDDNAGLTMVNEINDIAASQQKGVLSYFGITPHAGHHLYLDNPKAFSKQVFSFLKV